MKLMIGSALATLFLAVPVTELFRGKAAPACTAAAGSTSISADTTLVAATKNLRLVKWTARESAGSAAAATVILRHGVVAGSDCTGDPLDFIELALNESSGDAPAESRGMAAASGICADVIAGTVDINVCTVVEAQ